MKFFFALALARAHNSPHSFIQSHLIAHSLCMARIYALHFSVWWRVSVTHCPPPPIHPFTGEAQSMEILKINNLAAAAVVVCCMWKQLHQTNGFFSALLLDFQFHIESSLVFFLSLSPIF